MVEGMAKAWTWTADKLFVQMSLHLRFTTPEWIDNLGAERIWDHYRFEDIIVRLSVTQGTNIGISQCHFSLHSLIPHEFV
jgi:hypothetical protein